MTAFDGISPMIWLDHGAEEAANLYVSLFPNARITDVVRVATEIPSNNPVGSVLTVGFEIEGQSFVALNGGPYFKLNPSISFFVNCDTADEVEMLFARLADGGTELMPLQAYPFSEKFGWVQDRFGMSWQINLGSRRQKIDLALMFSKPHEGQAGEAIRFYTSVFDGSHIDRIEHYADGDEGGTPGMVKIGTFQLGGRSFAAMDSSYDHGFTFNEALSLSVGCASQAEIDAFWAVLSADPESEQCGWCKDRFGVSWQVVPVELNQMMLSPDPEQVRRVTEAFMPMKKLDLAALRKAYAGEQE